MSVVTNGRGGLTEAVEVFLNPFGNWPLGPAKHIVPVIQDGV